MNSERFKRTRATGPVVWLFALLAMCGIVVLGVAAVFAIAQCYDVCEEGSGYWFSRKGAWERWAQLLAVAVLAGLLVASAGAAFRGRLRLATWLALAGVLPLIAWIALLQR
jgi:hypothetical protein